MLIDTHTHYDHKRFDCGRRELLDELRAAGIDVVVNAAISYESNFVMRRLLGSRPWVYFAAGIHPNYAAVQLPESDAEREAGLRELLGAPRTVAVGETGLDYFRVREEAGRQRQRELFRRHLAMSAESGLPLILHIREADGDALAILRENRIGYSGVVHCFCGGVRAAEAYLAMGFSLGIGGYVTYGEAEELRRVVRMMPKDRILLETDAPFVMPDGCGKGRNSSKNLPIIARAVADIRGMSAEEAAELTASNARRIFCL